MNKALEDKKFNKAINYLDEMIRRYPLNEKLRKNRIYCYQKLNMSEEAQSDINFIKTYLITNNPSN